LPLFVIIVGLIGSSGFFLTPFSLNIDDFIGIYSLVAIGLALVTGGCAGIRFVRPQASVSSALPLIATAWRPPR
jgi:ABC-type branched-subunit amino acid transport system permease subunit